MKSTTQKTLLIVGAIALAAACGKDDDPNTGSNGNPNGDDNNVTNNVTNADPNNMTNVDPNNMTNVDPNNMTNVDPNAMTNNVDPGEPGDCETYCDTVMANCTGEYEQYESREACVDYCSNVSGWEAGLTGDVDGNTIGCRTYHGGDPSAGDPALHCYHAGPSGGGVCGSYCETYCQLTAKHCVGANALYDNNGACMQACAGFDASGTPGDIEYDTVQCRIYHAGAPAFTDADLHCGHSGEVSTMFCIGSPEDFNFRTDSPANYTRVDRLGMPAVSTALIASKDAYNDDDPAGDVAGTYVGEIVATLNVLHGALDDDITGAGLTPCDMADNDADGLPDCVGQEVLPGGPTVAGLVLPDTIKIDPAGAAGFPNGRLLPDPVIDVTLAVILLDMSVHGPGVLAGLPLNPATNDVGVEGAFLTSFPYLHPPHTP